MQVSNKMITTLVIVVAFLTLILLLFKRYVEDYTSDFIDLTIYSSVLDENRKLFIRLPNNYDEKKRYPMIIKSDGNFNLSRWDEVISELSQQGSVNDSILIAIPNLFLSDSRNRDLVPPYARKDVTIEARPASDNSPLIFGKGDLFLRFIETELIPYIEDNYSINNNRILSGFSAGGSFVLYALVSKPELFTGYFSFSPAAWYDNSVVVDEFKKGLNGVKEKPLYLYLSLGGDENAIISGSFKGLLSAIESNAPASLYTEYSYSKGANHELNPYISVPKALKGYYRFRATNAAP
ncbi:alpha/beta hydrolase-fold protein [Paraglaciecola sp.]|uniref:alpha/beta hydrolase n=2 Tax=Paraglaciecola sp. TaxID=1920173 RepID=UPI00329A7861